jgi:hypothetical protein
MIKYTDPPQSRNEEILKATINGTSYDKEPQSRIEDLLIELKAAIEGGGGGGTTNYNLLENRPQINSHTLEGNMSFADLGIDETPTEDSTNAVASGGVYAGLADKIDKSSTGYETITGNPIEFDSPSPQIVGMKCDIVASQDLHGYDKPWAGGEGKNKLPMTVTAIKQANTSGTWNGNAYTVNGVTFTVQTDNDGNVTGINVNGTASGGAAYLVLDGNFNSTALAGCITTGQPTNTASNIIFRISNQYNFAAIQDLYYNNTITDNGDNLRLSLRININYTVNNVAIYPMLRLSTETDPTFEPYSNICPISGVDTIDIDVAGGETYTIDLDGTRYGGQLDVTSGVLTLTHGEIASYDGETLPSAWISDRDEYQAGTTPTTGAQVVYELATPQTIQLTPTQVWAVQGGNTITVSVDGVEAEIHSSNYATLKDINDLWNYIKQSPQGSSDGVKFGASNLEMIGGTMA